MTYIVFMSDKNGKRHDVYKILLLYIVKKNWNNNSRNFVAQWGRLSTMTFTHGFTGRVAGVAIDLRAIVFHRSSAGLVRVDKTKEGLGCNNNYTPLDLYTRTHRNLVTVWFIYNRAYRVHTLANAFYLFFVLCVVSLRHNGNNPLEGKSCFTRLRVYK